MTPRNYTDEELIREIERCYTDEVVLELLRRFLMLSADDTFGPES